jgi:Ca-activated chloride channel family protein
MSWGCAAWLWYGLPALALAAWLVAALRARRRRKLGLLAGDAGRGAMLPGYLPGRDARRLALRFAGLALVVVALARPQWGFHWEEVKRRGLDIVVVLDTSRSMLAADVAPNRLQQAKWGVHDLLRQLQGDRVGLVPFAGSAVVQCPPTLDYAAFGMLLDDLHCGIIPRGGTAIAQALRLAAEKGFGEEETGADKVVLLITDGEDHEGDPLSLLPMLKQKGIRVYGIGIGTPEGELLPGDAAGGYFKDRAGQVVKSSLHEDVLQKLAIGTGGAYVRSVPGDSGLERVFRESIAQLKRAEQEGRTARVNEERYPPFVLAALALFAWEAALSGVRRGGKRGPGEEERAR